MKKSPWAVLLFLMLVFGSILAFLISSRFMNWKDSGLSNLRKEDSIMVLEVSGVIMDGKKLLEPLKKYREENHIKAFVIHINSPGGVVGPSQELFIEIKRTREKYKKPVVAVSTSLMASGAFYAAMAADKVVVAPGTLVGSIGVIMEFMNLEKLYEWAKLSRYSVTTGKYKDSGAEYRTMREDERELFQNLIDEVYSQFVTAVAEGRNMTEDLVKPWADGRVFTGAQAVQIGFADKTGVLEDAISLAGVTAGLLEDGYKVVHPPKPKPTIWEVLFSSEEEETGTIEWSGDASLSQLLKSTSQMNTENMLSGAMKDMLKAELLNKPLYLMPGTF